MQVNGKHLSLEKPISITEFLVQQGYQEDRVAVEKNKNIIPKKNFSTELLNDNDTLEIVNFVGGG